MARPALSLSEAKRQLGGPVIVGLQKQGTNKVQRVEPRRFANDEIVRQLQDVLIPFEDRTRKSDSPYYYGLDEATWRASQDHLQGQVLDLQRRGGSKEDMIARVMDTLNIGEGEASAFVNYDARRDNTYRGPAIASRHVARGVPHIHGGEDLMREALVLSGRPTQFNNTDNHMATDLVTMLGNLETYVDVQNRVIRPGAPDMLSSGFVQKVRPNVVPRVLGNARPSTTLGQILDDIRTDSGGQFVTDKLLENKSLIIGGRVNRNNVNNLTGAFRHGNYHTDVPEQIGVHDNKKLSDALLGMTKEELESLGGGIMQGIEGDRSNDLNYKFKIQLPMDQVLQLGTPQEQLLSQGVLEALESLRTGRLR